MSDELKQLASFTDEDNNRYCIMSDGSTWAHGEGMNEPFQVATLGPQLAHAFIARLAAELEQAREAIRWMFASDHGDYATLEVVLDRIFPQNILPAVRAALAASEKGA